jgi:hypothetical protein
VEALEQALSIYKTLLEQEQVLQIADHRLPDVQIEIEERLAQFRENPDLLALAVPRTDRLLTD